MKKISVVVFAITFTVGIFALAQTPLKLSTKPSEKPEICKAGNQSFEIKNAEDRDVCNKLKKPDSRGSATPPQAPVASPNPISNPPTGN